ncbi:ChaN family lipoprotein [Cognatishimia sp. F0-27]|uniref:ChaN family lipoprotein n=1 Tax=Cognatishimia sp. F0-27 TaxID=2816855 RepID=UPI001D0CC1EE|nr:ChaN family lipoprotein [Cognatishimia sp. F0-27]MCC1493951.1 ChaN family lipoprotein [Cognatishimia sp. F0-27]
MRRLFLVICLIAAPVLAVGGDLREWRDADVVFLGEQHDNPAHHARQAALVEMLRPTALVFEMLTEAQAARVTPALRGDRAALADVLDWDASGWPDFAMYYPIFAAAPDAEIRGAAIPRDQARAAMQTGMQAVFGPEAADFGLTERLPEAEQAMRQTLQAEAHCNALPETMLPVMVEIQRLRDAALARAARDAVAALGGPVVVITGNGHARLDWGAPAALERAAPTLSMRSLGQGETPTGAPPGGFDVVEITAPVDRGDPCAAFR